MTPCRNPRSLSYLRPTLLGGAVLATSALWAGAALAETAPRAVVANKASAPMQSRSDIEGPLTAINGNTLTVLGQTVHVNKATVFDGSLKAGVSALRVGQVLEIDGVADAQGTVTASRIELEDDNDPFKLRGQVSKLDTSKRTFQLGNAVVSYADVSPTEKDTMLTEGTQVEVRLNRTAKADVWQATRVRTLADRVDGQFASAEIEGKVSEVLRTDGKVTGLMVNGIKVDTRGVDLPNGLEKDSKVEVKGHMNGGMLIAKKVDRELWLGGDGDLDVEGQISSVDAAGQTFSLNGVKVDFRGARIDDGRKAAALLPGVKVEVRGTLSRDGTTVTAKEIDID